jgi:hypothetical protein
MNEHDSQGWFALQPSWRTWFESGARRCYGSELRSDLTEKQLIYTLDDLDVTGRRDSVPLRIVFQRARQSCLDRENLPWNFTLPPEDYPRVYADPDKRSHHRLRDNALCLFYPSDPPERRWQSADGLLALIDRARDHIFCETHWRRTGLWLLDEAPHDNRSAA